MGKKISPIAVTPPRTVQKPTPAQATPSPLMASNEEILGSIEIQIYRNNCERANTQICSVLKDIRQKIWELKALLSQNSVERDKGTTDIGDKFKAGE